MISWATEGSFRFIRNSEIGSKAGRAKPQCMAMHFEDSPMLQEIGLQYKVSSQSLLAKASIRHNHKNPPPEFLHSIENAQKPHVYSRGTKERPRGRAGVFTKGATDQSGARNIACQLFVSFWVSRGALCLHRTASSRHMASSRGREG